MLDNGHTDKPLYIHKNRQTIDMLIAILRTTQRGEVITDHNGVVTFERDEESLSKKTY